MALDFVEVEAEYEKVEKIYCERILNFKNFGMKIKIKSFRTIA